MVLVEVLANLRLLTRSGRHLQAAWACLSIPTQLECSSQSTCSAAHLHIRTCHSSSLRASEAPTLHLNSNILDGKLVAQQWLTELAVEVSELSSALGRQPSLSVVVVGSRPDSLLYVTRKQEACQKAELESDVRNLCQDPSVDGVLIQLPLPSHLDEESIMEHIDPRKDVDGFHPLNQGRMLMRGRVARFIPCTPLGCMELLARSGVTVTGRSAVVVGDSNIVGTPLAAMLRDNGAAAVTVCHQLSYQEWFIGADGRTDLQRAAADACLPRLPGPSTTTSSSPSNLTSTSNTPAATSTNSAASCGFQACELPGVTRAADILVVAVGVPQLVRRGWVKPGAVVIDVGINVVPEPRPGESPSQQSRPVQTSNSDPHKQTQQDQQQQQQYPGPTASSCSTSSRGTIGGGDVGGGGAPGTSMFTAGTYHVVGDVHFEEVSQVASAITPVPGGVGPMTIAAVLSNTLKAARYNAGLLKW